MFQPIASQRTVKFTPNPPVLAIIALSAVLKNTMSALWPKGDFETGLQRTAKAITPLSRWSPLRKQSKGPRRSLVDPPIQIAQQQFPL
jgi:hypothetical protein